MKKLRCLLMLMFFIFFKINAQNIDILSVKNDSSKESLIIKYAVGLGGPAYGEVKFLILHPRWGGEVKTISIYNGVNYDTILYSDKVPPGGPYKMILELTVLSPDSTVLSDTLLFLNKRVPVTPHFVGGIEIKKTENSVAAVSEFFTEENSFVWFFINKGEWRFVSFYSASWAPAAQKTGFYLDLDSLPLGGDTILIKMVLKNKNQQSVDSVQGFYKTPTVGVFDTKSQSAIVIYPNPATDLVIISGLKPRDNIKIMNNMNNLESEIITDSKKVLIPVDSYPPGMYFYRISSTTNFGGVWTGKFIVE